MTDDTNAEKSWLPVAVVSLAAEHLVMDHMTRRNVLTYKAPPGNEGYDLVCIQPDPRHVQPRRQVAQVRVQVKSRHATDCGPASPSRTSASMPSTFSWSVALLGATL